MDALENARLAYGKIAAAASSHEYNCVDGSSKNVMVDLDGLEHAKGRTRSTSGRGSLNRPGVLESRTNDRSIGGLADLPARWLSVSLRPERGWDTDSMAVLSLGRSDVDSAEVSAAPEKASGLLDESGHG
jgi:hypothetical protein